MEYLKSKELYHWGLKLGAEKENHKYYQRINLGSRSKPKYRYFYTKKEYDTYMKASQVANKFKSLGYFLNSTAKNFGGRTDYKQLGRNFLSGINKKEPAKKETNKPASDFYKKAESFISKNKNLSVNLTAVKKTAEKKSKKIQNRVASSISKVNNLKDRVTTFVTNTKASIKRGLAETNERHDKFVNARNIFGDLSKNNNKKSEGLIVGPDKALRFIAYHATKIARHALRDIRKTDVYKNISNFISNLSKKSVDTIDQLINKPDQKIDKPEEKTKEPLFRRIKEKLSPKQNRDTINPNYEEDAYYQTNCYSCSISYDLRLKGLDVKAIPDIYGGMTNEEIESFYKGGEFIATDFSDIYNSLDQNYEPFVDEKKDRQLSKQLADELKKQLLAESNGEDSSGFTVIRWYPYGGHIFNYEIVNGEVHFIDTQPTEKYSGNSNHEADIEEYISRSQALNKNYAKEMADIDSGAIYTMRTDNLEIDKSRMSYVTCPAQIANSGKVENDLMEQAAWVYMNMYNDYTEKIKTGELKRDEPIYPIGGWSTYVTYDDLERIIPDIVDVLEDQHIETDWIDDLEYAKKFR